MAGVEVVIDPSREGHLFRLPSEFDPTKEKSKGGFLNGQIQLPFFPRMVVTLTSHPSEELLADYPETELANHPELSNFSPCLLYNSRKKGGRLQYRRMYIPFLQHYRQQLLVDNGSVFIKSSPSKFDEARTDMEDIPEWDKLFDLDTKDMKLRLGGTDKTLNIQVLYPKTEACSKAEEDVTVTKMLEDRNIPRHFASFFNSGKNKTHPNHVIRIKVDISVSAGMLPNKVEHWVPYAGGLSEPIVHTKSKNRGSFEMHDRNPGTSCSQGGVKVWMKSEFPLPKDVVPEFQVWNGGERLGKEEERRLINNENIEAKTFKDHVLTFKTPTQDVNNLHEIISRNYEIKLVARRKSDNAHSKPFPFFFFTHNEIMMSDINGSQSCLYCSIYANEEMPSIKQAIPGEKKRKIPSSAEKKKTSKSRRVSEALSNGSGILSPDSAIGISPSHDGFENLIDVPQASENGISHNPLGSAARVEDIQEESHNHNCLENGTSLEVAENTKEMLVDGSTEEHSNSEEFTGAENIIEEILEKESQSPGIVEKEILDPEMLERLIPDEILVEDSPQVIETDQAKAKNEEKERTKKPKSSRPSGTKARRESVNVAQSEEDSAKPESVQHMGTATTFKQSILHDYADILTDARKSLIPRLVLVFLLLALQLAGHRTEERNLSKLVSKIGEAYWTFPFLLFLQLILISGLGWFDESFASFIEGGGLLLGMLASLAAAGVISVAIARTV